MIVLWVACFKDGRDEKVINVVKERTSDSEGPCRHLSRGCRPPACWRAGEDRASVSCNTKRRKRNVLTGKTRK